MRAMTIPEFGPPDVLTPAEVPTPEPGPGQVRVRVVAAGALPVDARIRRGEEPWRSHVELPLVPGNEFAGTVDAVGPGTAADGTAPRVGAEVLGFTTLGAYAEFVVVPADQVVPKPADMPWEVAGGFSAQAQGAHMALAAVGAGPGDTVLIGSAAGGLGTFAVQLARVRGAATVIGTAGPRNHDHLRSLGAVPVSYGPDLVERVRALAPRGVDAAVDSFDEASLRQALEIVGDPRRVTSMVAHDAARALGLAEPDGVRSGARLAGLVRLYEEGRVRPHIRAAHRFTDAALAHRDLDSGHGRGKLVLTGW
ncbi:NADP-dependent oxidoreductase [Nocardiopsis aegyptia]|uniref:NADPH:quinone reductase-like Zn-dependent oxidoreductase n=1 Tax=Nocardiopsis aegyptia TaxID=220378 RepID=A0A7Z0EMQ0_9ACTN|nr:NADP-dependent oxidoreductase [Nocardiopsis aegyptia]NYJ34030.1 NADPH:quinone reductase-like Zn-dependent oxidoreductase [Nocardiopsis aegyptia]